MEIKTNIPKDELDATLDVAYMLLEKEIKNLTGYTTPQTISTLYGEHTVYEPQEDTIPSIIKIEFTIEGDNKHIFYPSAFLGQEFSFTKKFLSQEEEPTLCEVEIITTLQDYHTEPGKFTLYFYTTII